MLLVLYSGYKMCFLCLFKYSNIKIFGLLKGKFRKRPTAISWSGGAFNGACSGASANDARGQYGEDGKSKS